MSVKYYYYHKVQMIEYPYKQSFLGYFNNIYRYRSLIWMLSKKWIKSKYEDSYIGMGWMVASPIITTLIFTFFFGLMFSVNINQVQYFLYIYSGMLPWLFFQDVFLEVLDIFPKEQQIIKRISFPRLVIPLSLICAKLIQFFFSIILLFVIAMSSGKPISGNIFMLPVIILQLVLIAMGLGLIFMVPCIIYRDLKHMLRFIVPLGMYTLPIFYKMRMVPLKWLRVYLLNPMVSFIQCFRSILFRENIPWTLLIKGMGVSIIVFAIGFAIFRKYEKKLTDFI
ncbi:MAG: ABC transporter permease [Bacteroidetes bacterium]|nr:ABC transporter permease [Bacteroidota bacterium]